MIERPDKPTLDPSQEGRPPSAPPPADFLPPAARPAAENEIGDDLLPLLCQSTGSAIVLFGLRRQKGRWMVEWMSPSPAAARMLGIHARTARTPWEQFAAAIHPEDAGPVETLLTGEAHGRAVLRILTGEEPERRVALHIGPIQAASTAGAEEGSVGERWGVLQELQNDIAGKEVEVLFHAFMDHLPGMALVKNSANRYVFINRALARFLGLRGDKAEWFGKGPADLFRGEEMVRLIQETDEAVATTGQALLREAEVLIQGQPRHFLMSKFPIHLPDGRMWVGAVTLEITALRTAEAALAESQRRLETLVNNLPGAVYRCRNDEAWTMLYLSEAIHAISGYPAADFLNNRKRSYASIVHPDDVAKVRRDVDQAVALDEPFTLEYRIIHADGQVRWVWERGRPVTVGGELYLEGFITDVTERRLAEEEHHRLEQHIREQQRLEAIGQLAGGVAHEINNPITGIINYAEILEEALPEDSDLREFTREIRHESERIARIIRTLLAFARPERTSRQTVTVSSLVENVFALVRTTLQNDLIKVFTEIPPQPLAVNCRPEQLQQLLLNLIANAREALNQRYPKGDPNKILSVHAASFERDGRPWIRLTVEDHGPGIPQADLPHVLNPFFTTKNRTRHAGLGLTVAQSIAADHGGRIRIESEAQGHTRVHVELPAASPTPSAAPLEPPAEA